MNELLAKLYSIAGEVKAEVNQGAAEIQDGEVIRHALTPWTALDLLIDDGPIVIDNHHRGRHLADHARTQAG